MAGKEIQKITRRQLLAYGVSALALADQATLNRSQKEIDSRVNKTNEMKKLSPAIPPTAAEDLRNKLESDIYKDERTAANIALLAIGLGGLIYDRIHSKKPPPDNKT